ncbi:MAG TPA: response regulator [Geothrix sp.]|jgi:CheY-like chemotaxis protein|nr:response regulator [Geothrix sp.]
MPRLLLVDDNPSIHRIAESLLAPTDVELVCVDSAAEALDRIGQGDRFDVILVDTAMPGMDGWTLLTRLREMEATAHLPIALMAGVLDPVDPAKLAKAPVQGFLKKPIELRELGDRVKALLAMPVVVASEPSAFTTVPATPAKDLVRMAEASLPEFRPDYPPMPEAVELPPFSPEPPSLAAFGAEPEHDLLALTAEDLWPEEAAEAAALPPAFESSAAPEVRLELEELDLESLQDLASGAMPAAPHSMDHLDAPMPGDIYELPDMEALAPEVEIEPPAPAFQAPATERPEAEAPLAEALGEESLLSFPDLEGLDGLPGEVEPAPAAAASAAPWVMPAVVPAVEIEVAREIPEPVPAASGQAPAASGQAPLTPEQIQALLGDPALMEALTKAVVTRMSDQAIREIAWEVMPDLAGRLQR